MKKYEKLISKLKIYEKKFEDISRNILSPNVFQKNYKLLLNKYNSLEKLFFLYKKSNKKLILLKEANFFIKNDLDLEMKKLAEKEKKQLIKELDIIEKEFKNLIIKVQTKNVNQYNKEDYRNVILEIRSGTGGNEACLFVEDMLRMYTMYFNKLQWKYKIIHFQKGEIGYKEIVIEVFGKKEDKIYGNLKFESGVHRVQRIPKTESQGRLHTSAVTVAVLPKVEDLEININYSDIKKDTFRSSGAGGQHVNKTESAVRLTYLPTKITAECQEERSQHKNFEKAMIILKSKIYKIEMDKKMTKRSEERKLLVSTGDRSVKIRTYNYPNNRVTDHRIHKSMHNLVKFMNGNIQDMIDLLKLILKQ
ncbi:peptide chain release factor 1 [Blattabacterium cuenoti]|uniref:peptide chain release factor 1 n=1 Tax=Blattabacterium cuenoti TaxID=1653831 RepID=UPI00163C0890|nr:PCRF domain-containing protein [Blattabacterium cuenoti]